jgi:hypothetical protein
VSCRGTRHRLGRARCHRPTTVSPPVCPVPTFPASAERRRGSGAARARLLAPARGSQQTESGNGLFPVLVSRAMLSRYSHVRMEAKGRARARCRWSGAMRTVFRCAHPWLRVTLREAVTAVVDCSPSGLLADFTKQSLPNSVTIVRIPMEETLRKPSDELAWLRCAYFVRGGSA